MIGVDHHTLGLAVLDRHPDRVHDEVRGLRGVDRPAHHPTRDASSTTAQYTLPLAGAVLSDVGQPQTVRLGPREVTVHEILCRWGVRDLADTSVGPASPARPRRRITSSTVQRATVILPAEDKLGVDTACCRRSGGTRHARHGRRQRSGVPHRPGRRAARAPRVEPRHRHPDDTAGNLDWEILAHDLGDDLPSPFGSVWALNNSLARFVTASSVSSSRMRFRAAAKSPDSTVVTPARQPAIDPVLPAPVVDRLVRHTELRGDLDHRPASLDQIEHLATELDRVPPRHDDLLISARDSSIPTARSPEQTSRRTRTSFSPAASPRLKAPSPTPVQTWLTTPSISSRHPESP